jgi:hypothetical protein
MVEGRVARTPGRSAAPGSRPRSFIQKTLVFPTSGTLCSGRHGLSAVKTGPGCAATKVEAGGCARAATAAVGWKYHGVTVRRGIQSWRITFCVCRRPESRPQGRRRAVHRLSPRLISLPAVVSGRRPRRGKRVLADAQCTAWNHDTVDDSRLACIAVSSNAGRKRRRTPQRSADAKGTENSPSI